MKALREKGFQKSKEVATFAEICVCKTLLSNDGVHIRLPEEEAHDHLILLAEINEPPSNIVLQDPDHGPGALNGTIVEEHLT